MFDKQYLKTSVGWGLILWLFGYILGFIFFAFVPTSYIGWVIMPFGIAFTLWVLFKKINFVSLDRYLVLGIIWMIIAVVFDYLFIIKVLNPADGYYKLDVYIYYAMTLLLPIVVWWWKNRKVM